MSSSASPSGRPLSLSIEDDPVLEDAAPTPPSPTPPTLPSFVPSAPAFASPVTAIRNPGRENSTIIHTSHTQPPGSKPSVPPLTKDKTRLPSDRNPRVSLLSECCPSDGRNLVICVDGTANQFGMKNTNVVELFSRLLKEENDKQLVYYNSGIGTYVKSRLSFKGIKQAIVHGIDMAIAWRFETIIHAAYEWLSENYKSGDRIFLFGFSRGAYQVRVIAGMIHKVGLLHKGNKNQIPFAYELYASTTSSAQRDPPLSSVKSEDGRKSKPFTIGKKGPRNPDGGPGEKIDLCKQFKEALCHSKVKVHFVGAWDTVSSIGIARGTSLPETTAGMKHVCVFRHALALDERRVKFLPEFANGGNGPTSEDKGGDKEGDVKEVWFAGSHSDIGGGNRDNGDLANFGPALRWMTYEAMSYGLQMRRYEGKWVRIRPTKSLTPIWLPFEVFPFSRLSYDDRNSTTFWPHFAKHRVIKPGQLIHESVIELLMQKPPTTANTSLPNDSRSATTEESMSRTSDDYFEYTSASRLELEGFESWKAILDQIPESNDKKYPDVIERDPFASAIHSLSQIRVQCQSLSEADVDFNKLGASVNALRSFLNNETHKNPMTEVPDAADTLLLALELDYQHSLRQPMVTRSTMFSTLLQLLAFFPPQKQRNHTASVIARWTSGVVGQPQSNEPAINKVMQDVGKWIIESKDIKRDTPYTRLNADRIMIGTQNEYMVWNVSTGELKTIYTFPGRVFRRGFTASADGSRIAYLCEDTLTVAHLEPAIPVLVSGDEPVDSLLYALCFSHDCSLLASGSDSGPVSLWSEVTPNQTSVHINSEDQDTIPGSSTDRVPKLCPDQLFGHTGEINALAFSDDDTYLASASDDRTVRVWSIKDKKEVIALEGHDQEVCSVAWKPSKHSIASGASDGRIIIWDLNGKKEFDRNSHLGCVWAVAFSPNGEMLASGGDDRRLRVWDVDARIQLWCFETDDWIRSVSFSDRLHLVTGEDEGKITLWNMDIREPAEKSKE